MHWAARMPIPDWPDYFADRHGQIWSRKSGDWRRMRLALESSGAGHLHVELGRGSRKSAMNVMVHRLVCSAFNGRPQPGQIARHLDGNPGNNDPRNLAWGTFQDNSADMIRHGRSLVGTKNHKAKLTDAEVLEIRRRRSNGETIVSLEAAFGVTNTNISFICLRRTWRHI